MKFSVKYMAVALFTALFCVSAYADGGVNTGYSPYSKFGIGRIARGGTAYSQSMGGAGVANRNTRYINTLNPAAVTARDTLAFMADFSITNENAYYRQGSRKSVDNTFNINNFVMSFPIWKSSAFMVGITPYSGLGYDFASPVTDENVIGTIGNLSDYYKGTGTLYETYVGAGVTFWKRLSLGAQFNFYFGQMEKTASRVFSSASQASIHDFTTMTIRSFSGKFGLQYEQPVGKGRITVGGTYKLPAKFRGDAEKMLYTLQSSVVDTLGTDNKIDLSKVNIPSGFTVGLSYNHNDVWNAQFDYSRSDWRKSGMTEPGFGSEGFTTTVAQSFNLGFEITPNRNDIRYYMRRVTYRIGAYYSQDYYKYSGNQISAAAVSLGLTLPVFRWSNGLTLGMEVGQRGSMDKSMVRETFVNFSVGFNIYDIWFVKPKYE